MAKKTVDPEVVAHAMLRLVGDHPERAMGRLRCARVVGGYAVAYEDPEVAEALSRYAVPDADWVLRDLTRLVDALIQGELLAQTPGPRPVLVLTRAGHRALEALEAGQHPGIAASLRNDEAYRLLLACPPEDADSSAWDYWWRERAEFFTAGMGAS